MDEKNFESLKSHYATNEKKISYNWKGYISFVTAQRPNSTIEYYEYTIQSL